MQRIRRISRGELARRTGVNSETIRYFEQIGILAVPARTEGGHRIYDEGHVRTLGFIRRARGLGFTPREVRALLELGGPGRARCNEVREIAERHLEQVQAKIADLADIEKILSRTIDQCNAEGGPRCPVIEMIEHPNSSEVT